MRKTASFLTSAAITYMVCQISNRGGWPDTSSKQYVAAMSDHLATFPIMAAYGVILSPVVPDETEIAAEVYFSGAEEGEINAGG